MASPKKNKTQPPATVQNFPIVGIGASAGGLDAFRRLLKSIPESSGMAYVLVQHLDPLHESILPEILQRVTKIPVLEITEDIHLAPDHIYIIPSNKLLTSTDGVLKLTPRERKILNLSIDIFFTSLANVHKEFAVGVVLSGTGSDGTLGLKAIKEHGGICIAQDTESAAFDSMPQSAVDAGVVDFILAPEKIPAQLLQIDRAYKTSHFFKDQEELPKDDEAIFKQILLLLRQRSGVDFTYYKQPTFHRRIARRIAIVKKKNLADYLNFLRITKAEQDALFHDVLIPVTSFLRDPKTFQTLTETVFPALFKNKSHHEPIRVWIAGCSTGEEAFSIAICLHEFLGDALNTSSWGRGAIQIFASDISEKAIKKARAAMYTKADVEKFSASQLKTYFTKTNGGYEVSKLIRDTCVFAPHNFLKDPPFAKMDLISCRNVLIYMDTFLQKKALTTFHYALKENGFLLLGKSETAGASSDLFTQVERHEKIYSRKPVPGRFMHVATERKEDFFVTKDKAPTKNEGTQTDFRKSAEAIMISKAPASVVVNEVMDIVHIHGDITPFLQSPQGKPTHNLIKMAREGLGFELRNAIHKATKEQTTIVKENISAKTNGKQALVTIEIIPLTDTIESHYLIRFEAKTIPVQEEMKSSSGKTLETSRKLSRQNQQLEKELSQTREDMRSITQDMEAANEELQSANEELQSSNEEMQSLNEELETSKEELQSTNEELLIVNQELLDKQEQLNISRFYSEAIVTTMRQPLVVLDRGLRIKTANASFYKIFNIDEKESENKLFYEIQNHQFDDTLLRTLLEKILPQKNRIEDYEINLHLPDKVERVILINARQIINEKKAEQLILLAMEDITDRVRSEKIVRENEARSEKERMVLHDFFIQAPAMCAILKGTEYVFEFANPAYREFVGHRELIGKPLLEALPEIAGQGFIELLDNVYNTGETFTAKEIPANVDKGNGKLEKVYVNFSYQAFKNDKGETEGVLAFVYDVTEQVNARRQIEASEKRFSNILSQSLMAIGILKGPEMVITSGNEPFIKILGKGNDIFGKPLLDVLPEMKDQPFPKMLDNVYATGIPLQLPETKAIINRNRKEEECYFNLVYQPYRDVDDTIIGITVFATEITEQVFAKKQIEESEKRFKVAIKASGHIAFAQDENLKHTWIYNSHPDFKAEDILGKDDNELHEPETAKQLTALKKEVLKSGIGIQSDVLMTINGEQLFYEIMVEPITNDIGIVTGVTGIAMDVTQKVVARKQIEASEKRFSNILSQSLMAIAIFKGEDMIIDFANEPLLKIWGKEKDIIGKPLFEVMPELKNQQFPKDLDDVYTTGIPFSSNENRAILTRNGIHEELFFSVVYQPYTEADDTITGVTVLGAEVTDYVHAKKQIEESEAKFRTLADNIPYMIWEGTPDGKKTFFNKYLLDYTGKTFKELTGDGFQNIIFPDDLEKDLQLWQHSLKTGEDFKMEKRLRCHDGTYRWHLSHGFAQKDKLGNISGWIGSSTDIDEHKTYAKELVEAKVFAEDEKAKAEMAMQSKQQFLSNMSHEIRTPMNAIIGFTKVLSKTDLSAKQKEYLEAIKASGSTLIVLINDILDLAKVDAGKMIFINSPFKISNSITTILHLFETKIQESNLELVKEYDSRIPEIVLGDSVRLHQILINLLSNAIKFTSRGKITVRVDLLNEDEEKVTLEIKVTDTGIGIPQNKIEAIFENFEQAHAITSSLYGGTGLGLAIVKQLVEKQGGTISVESKVDVGSTFSFTLSFQKSNADPDSYREENEEEQYKTEIKPLKVLVVEDVKLNQLLMRTILNDFNFAWDIADNGKIAIEKLQTTAYDIILMDLQMPIMNGFETTEHIRNKMNLQIPIIALTADVTTVDVAKCKSVGMNDYISKPVDENLLYSKILDLIKVK